MAPEGSNAPLVKSKRRVADHGEVFTPAWLVDDMLDLVKAESERIDSRVLEPACGSGNFLVPMLRRKLATVEARYGKAEFERRHHALHALMCIYGIELLSDNAAECRANLLGTFSSFLGMSPGDSWDRAARRVLEANIVQGDALSMTDADGAPIVFPEWGYLGRGRYQRRDFRYDNLTQRASFQGTLWEHLEEHEIFTPTKEYPPMTVEELAA
jgi:Type I restriction-modification system methyltransferase subunit